MNEIINPLQPGCETCVSCREQLLYCNSLTHMRAEYHCAHPSKPGNEFHCITGNVIANALCEEMNGKGQCTVYEAIIPWYTKLWRRCFK